MVQDRILSLEPRPGTLRARRERAAGGGRGRIFVARVCFRRTGSAPPVPASVDFVSVRMILEPGTVILTGTPLGVGFARTPSVFLRARGA